jgi:hypothetical protein
MIPLFDSDSLPRSRERLEEGAVLFRGFATSEAPALVEEVARIAQGRRWWSNRFIGAWWNWLLKTRWLCGRLTG